MGHESPTQFNTDYKRLFGEFPHRHAAPPETAHTHRSASALEAFAVERGFSAWIIDSRSTGVSRLAFARARGCPVRFSKPCPAFYSVIFEQVRIEAQTPTIPALSTEPERTPHALQGDLYGGSPIPRAGFCSARIPRVTGRGDVIFLL